MKKVFLLFIIVVLLQFAPAASAQTTQPLESTTSLQQIIFLLERIKQLQLQLAGEQFSLQSAILPTTTIIETRYRVYDPQNFDWVEDKEDAAFMSRFVELTPDKFDSSLDEFVFFKKSDNEYDAFVETLGNAASWRVGFNSELKQFSLVDTQTTELFIHEIGHLVSLEEIDNEVLLKQFEEEFWDSSQKRSGFVSEYAKQNVAEDFAESFLEFVLDDKDYKGVAAKKVNFFSRYPGLKKIRTEIRSNI